MPTWDWLPATEERILRPALESLDPTIRPAVERDLAKLLANPEDPDLPWTRWRGADEPRPSRVAILAGRVAIRYVVYKDFPLVGVVAMIDLGEFTEAEEDE